MEATPQTRRETFYLDTTAAYFLRHGHSLQKQAVLDLLRDSRRVISRSVRAEYLRGVVITMIEFYFLVKVTGDVANAIIDWTQTFRPRRLKVWVQILPRWITAQEEWANVTITLRRLGNSIVRMTENFDAEFPCDSRDRLGCEVAGLRFPEETFSETMLFDLHRSFDRARKGEPACRLCEFRRYWEYELKRRHIDLCSEEQRANFTGRSCSGYIKQAKLLEKVQETNSTRPRCKWCEKLGDSIIALQCPKHAVLVASDNSFGPLCTLLDKRHRHIPSLAELKREAESSVRDDAP